MTDPKHRETACPGRTDHPAGHKTSHAWWILPITGLLALIWFLARVLPKPSRAAYPCQQVAAPIAGGFVLWITGIVGSAFAFRKARALLGKSRVRLALACLAVAAAASIVAVYFTPDQSLQAANPEPNAPIGQAKGVHPGRVVWVHNPDATDWAGPGYGHWWEPAHTNQAVVDTMMSGTIRSLAGQPSEAAAWDALIRQFNVTHGRGDVGYTPGEKVCIKVNLVGCIYNSSNVNSTSYELVGQMDYMNTAPQVMLSLLRQLVNVVGVNQADISIGDPLARFPNQYYDPLHAEFPNVRYLDHDGGNASHPRTKVLPSTVPFYWSARAAAAGKTQDYIPVPYAEATYFIDLANFKSHQSAGVTLCAKNHFGSLGRTPPASGYYNMHNTLANALGSMGQYRCLVDLLGYAHTGGKALLYLIDGLYSGQHPNESSPRKWLTAPFNNDWTSSLFASQDPVAIDSVAFDFLWTEWSSYPHMPGADDYLHEAALADNPPSGTFYDPDHPTNTVRMASLGTHEHWNNAQDRQYSRNLGTGSGIELIKGGWPVAVIAADPTSGKAPLNVSFDGSGSYDSDPSGSIVEYRWDFESDGTIDATGPTAAHVYTSAGDRLASLTVVDNDGFSHTASLQITIDRQPGDFDSDYDVDQADFGVEQACLSGNGSTASGACVYADLDHDRDVDTDDIARFINCLSGPEQLADPACSP